MEENVQNRIVTQHQPAINQDANIMRIRLDTSGIIHQLQLTLSGKAVTVGKDAKGQLVRQEVDVSERLMNDKGVHAIVNWVSGIVNTQTVQGYWKYEEMYRDYIADTRRQLAIVIMENFYEWEVKENHFRYIVDSILSTVKWFATRSFDNTERDSYGNTFRHQENVGVPKPTSFGIRG